MEDVEPISKLPDTLCYTVYIRTTQIYKKAQPSIQNGTESSVMVHDPFRPHSPFPQPWKRCSISSEKRNIICVVAFLFVRWRQRTFSLSTGA